METLQHKLTSETVLNILLEQHRLCSPMDIGADPSVELSFDTTIAEWRYANDLLPWRTLSQFLNDSFNISATEREWENVLEPAKLRNLRNVCELVAKHSTHSNIESIPLFGKECLSASVFLTLKKYLQRRNVDVSSLKPSSLLSDYFTKYYSEMSEQITILSNGKPVIDKFDVKRKKTGFFNYINIFDKDRYELITGDLKTFRDLTLKIIEVNKSISSL